jgi:hypothetical protein
VYIPFQTVLSLYWTFVKSFHYFVILLSGSELLGFGLCPLPGILKSREQRFGNRTCFRPQVRGETTTLLGPLQIASSNHWTAHVSITFIFISMGLPAHSGPWPLIQFLNHFSQTVGLLGRVISPSQGRYLNTRQHKHRINAYTHQIPMPSVGFEPTISASERAKTVHALDVSITTAI